MKKAAILALATSLHFGCNASTTADDEAASRRAKPVQIRIIAINDLHGNLADPNAKVADVPAGGAAYLATHVKNLRAENPNSVFVAAGDLIGASPLLSAAFKDEPTILAMNQMGLDFSAVGNHEFDRGEDALVRMQEGGCDPVAGCYTSTPFPGASFDYLSADVLVDSDNDKDPWDPTFFRGYHIRSFEGFKIAFVGTVLDETPTIAFPDNIAGLTFEDEATAINGLVPEIRARGVQAIVVLTHEGNLTAPTAPYDGCDASFTGDMGPFVQKLDPMVVAVVSGHTHRAYNCLLPRSDGEMIPVTQAQNNGLLVTTLDLTASRAAGVQSIVAHNHIVSHDVTPDPDVAATIDSYNTLIAPVANRVVGSSTELLPRPTNHALSWTSLGSLIADAQLESTATRAGAVMAFINAGGVRADLPAGDLTYGTVFGIQPFSNQVLTMTLTGQQILTALEQQMASPADPHCLQPSAGFTFTFSASSTPHVSNVLFNGAPLDPAASYRVTLNNFIAGGGDNFSVFKQGTNITIGQLDLDALLDYLAAHNPVSAPAPRVTSIP